MLLFIPAAKLTILLRTSHQIRYICIRILKKQNVAKSVVETPLMKQYYEIKEKHPDAILLFRVGDFYETFSEDAVIAAGILGITLTRRANGSAQFVELAGFPHHALDTYLPKLVRAGKRVAVCDQLEDPKQTKKLVKRGITELVTPGIAVRDNILNHKENNYLAAVHLTEKDRCGLSLLDISTGEFLATEGSVAQVDKLLNNFMPKEVLIEHGRKERFQEIFGHKFLTFQMDDWVFTQQAARERLLKHFETKNLKGFGIENMVGAVITAGAALCYLDSTQHTRLSHISTLARIDEERYVRLDKYTVRSLELISTMNEGGKSLLDILDKTISPMGSRLLRRWLMFPLKSVDEIRVRQLLVEHFLKNNELREFLSEQLSFIGDLERIISRVAVGRVSPREIVQLKVALMAIGRIKGYTSGDASYAAILSGLQPCEEMVARIEREIVPEPPLLLNKGGIICKEVNEELDKLRAIAYSGRDYLMQIQQREAERTGIPSLKIAFNNVFGFFIEVRNAHKDKVPDDWIRKQTLVNAERYITQELKEYEEQILGADEKIVSLESALFADLVGDLMKYVQTIQKNARIVAQIDVLLSFARAAQEYKYSCPVVDDSDVLNIKEGRHPVIEQLLPIGEKYIPNNVKLDEKTQIIIITGPNMAGKSALLRQTALIALMAQIGSFVPADSATIGLVDKIFTRVGASDNISMGESTFMVEMSEASDILNNISARSLILFDELGRGTSTYDGISIAWAIVEYIHEHPTGKAKTLFATHYHELNEMAKNFKRIKNFNVSVKEVDNKVIFLRKLEKGGSEHSFGIHVAKMAGMPHSIVKRADEILLQMEGDNRKNGISKPMDKISSSREGTQLSIFQLDDPVLSQIRDEIAHLDINNLTPMEALNKLNEIRKIITGK